MQVMGREAAADALQLMHVGAARMTGRAHADVFGQLAALAQIARRAGGDDVLPRGAPALGARQDVIEGQILVRAAILAGEAIA